MKVPALVLPPDFRKDLSYPQGVLVAHPSGGEVSGLRADVTVGDVVSQRHTASIRVVDFKTRRHIKALTKKGECINVVNPRGSLSLMSITLSSQRNVDFCIVGEEDMLVIAFMLARKNTILYGQPDIGVVVVEPLTCEALKVLKILKPAIVET